MGPAGLISKAGWPAALAAAGLLLRLAYVWHTRAEPPHPDLGSFLPASVGFAHFFDTCPREPFHVWWLWLIGKFGAVSTAGIRLAGTLWFLPSFLLFCRLARRLLGERAALAAALLYVFLPAQVQSDCLGLRHVIEIFGVLLLLNTLFLPEGLRPRLAAGGAAVSFITLVLSRVNYAGSGLLAAAYAGLRLRSPRPLLALLPALLLLGGHLYNNKARTGDFLYSVNMHTYFFTNLEYIGEPGFPATYEDWQKAPHTPALKFRAWAARHSPAEFLAGCAEGLYRGLWDFYLKVYFAAGLPAMLTWALLLLYAAGAAACALDARLRFLPVLLLLFNLPYAFVAHVFWAGRFYTPFAPLALLCCVRAGELALERLPLWYKRWKK
jgi:4-amino-4-deoxy-L-arabinose transferase-like glycosyltransferase